MKKAPLITPSIAGFSVVIALVLIALCFCPRGSYAQNVRNTDYKADQSLKSNARVNPSTLAMELSIPIGGYAGRAGNGLPVSFDYSSKVWQIKAGGSWEGQNGVVTDAYPQYAERNAGGWTSSLGSPQIDLDSDVYENPGTIHSDYITISGGNPPLVSLSYVKRLHVIMPDGSSHEFRQNDAFNLCGDSRDGCTTDYTGTYLSVDGTRMRLEYSNASSTLYLPNGSRYLFGGADLATTLIDRNGNRMDYNLSLKSWTDNLGRIVGAQPLLDQSTQTQTVGDTVAAFPGINGGTTNVTFSSHYLKDPNGGESGLNDPSQTLMHLSDRRCTTNATNPLDNPLFSTPEATIIRVCGQTAQFNPVVLTKITLANGQSYQFKYNLYGEIEKVIYPTGAYERFSYAYVQPIQPSGGSYDQANRGVTDRWLSVKGDGTDEAHWSYQAVWSYQQPYRVITTAPDTTKTEQYLLPDSLGGSSPYGFGDVKSGRSYEDKAYSTVSSGNQLLMRHLTTYEWTGAQTGGYSGATRDLRPSKEVNITFEPGNSYALAQMSETVYEVPGQNGVPTDPAYFAALNARQTKTYHYVALSAANAQSWTIDQIAVLFSASNLAATSEVDYLYDAGYKARNITGLAIDSRIKDASGVVKAKSQIVYDEGTYLEGVMSTTVSGWENPNTNVRGLATTTRSWSDVANNQSIETHASYDQFGNVRKRWDGRGKFTEIQYADNYSDNTNRNSFALPTKTISSSNGDGTGILFETSVKYDFNTGLPVSTTDANNQTTQMSYLDPVTNVVDPLLRVRKVTAPNGQQTITEYGAGTSAATRFTKVKTQIDETKWKEGYSWYDGLGRTYKSQSVDSQSGDVFTKTLFDSVGRPWKTSNHSTPDSQLEWTENAYDTAGRLWKVTTPDGAHVDTTYNLATTGNQIGTAVTITDQAGKQRRSITNALGQLKRVDEPDVNNNNQLGLIDNPNQPTVYSYDVLNNLTQVQQNGVNTAQCGGTTATCTQTRSFVYDSLSRLKTATNPESGLISYQYDDNGNLTKKTDARNVETSYIYDALNRVTNRSYAVIGTVPSNYEATLPVTYTYEDTNVPFSKGKLTKVTTGDVSTPFSVTKYTAFDVMGRVTASEQITPGVIIGAQTYTYNLSGALIEEKYPSGRIVKNVLDNNGDLETVQSKKNQNAGFWNYAKNFNYTAAGAVNSMQLGNGRWESTQFNSRLQPTQIALGTVQNGTDKLKLNFTYSSTPTATDNNGNVLSQTITAPTETVNSTNHPAFTATQNYSYDSLNRLKSAEETVPSQTGWKQTFKYDRYGNRNFDTTNAGNNPLLDPNCVVAVCNPTVDPATNKLVGYGYDSAGNTKTDAQGKTFTYDSENKQVKVMSGTTSIGDYFYDGDGKRIKKIAYENGVEKEITIFAYDAEGKMVAEYSTVVATPTDAKVSYLTSDGLGSPRINTDANGATISRHDYMPFGEEVNRGYYNDGVRKQFTSYERDNESDLDFARARYFNSRVGRFNSPDPYNIILEVKAEKNEAKAREKLNSYINITQQWNRFSYVLNNPLKFIDPSGEIFELIGTQAERDRSLEWLKKALGDAAGKKLSIEIDGGHFYVKFSGTNEDGNQLGEVVNSLISSNSLTTFSVTTQANVKLLNGNTINLDNNGGASTTMISEGTNQIFIRTNAVSTADYKAALLGEKDSSGNTIKHTNETIVAHELGHAWGAVKDNFYTKYQEASRINSYNYVGTGGVESKNRERSLTSENFTRGRLGLPSRIHHY